MIQIAIVDDEKTFRLDLARDITAYFEKKAVPCNVRAFTCGEEFLEDGQPFDCVFLDIQMRGLSGMEVAQRLRQRGDSCFLVFITVLQEYVYDAFEVEASDYLLKPPDAQRFTRTMDRVLHGIQSSDNGCLLVPARGNEHFSLPFCDIYYCEAVSHRVELHTKDAVHFCHSKIETLAALLDRRFFRCHRSYFINLDHIRGYEDGEALLVNGERIPVSRLRGREFSQAVLCRMKETKKL